MEINRALTIFSKSNQLRNIKLPYDGSLGTPAFNQGKITIGNPVIACVVFKRWSEYTETKKV